MTVKALRAGLWARGLFGESVAWEVVGGTRSWLQASVACEASFWDEEVL